MFPEVARAVTWNEVARQQDMSHPLQAWEVAVPAQTEPEYANGTGVHGCEFVLTETMAPDEPVEVLFARLIRRLQERQAVLLGLMIYGSVDRCEIVEAAMRLELGEPEWPVTWVEGASCNGALLAGVQAFAVSGRPVERIRIGHRVVGSVLEDETARHCLLGGLGPVALALEPRAQVQQMFGNLELALERAGLALGDVVRTWFYNADILAWYPEFNRVRSAYYAGVKWRAGSLPASTGIGARNPSGAAVQVALWAVRPLVADSISPAREIGSPLQCPAPAYGSSFSRAMEVESGGWRRLQISGTASIHPDGRTAWVDDPRRQLDLTMAVVEAILQSRRMGFSDVTRATVYLRHPQHAELFRAWQVGRDLPALPVVVTHSVVCRDDLLFEIEVDAVRAGGG